MQNSSRTFHKVRSCPTLGIVMQGKEERTILDVGKTLRNHSYVADWVCGLPPPPSCSLPLVWKLLSCSPDVAGLLKDTLTQQRITERGGPCSRIQTRPRENILQHIPHMEEFQYLVVCFLIITGENDCLFLLVIRYQVLNIFFLHIGVCEMPST